MVICPSLKIPVDIWQFACSALISFFLKWLKPVWTSFFFSPIAGIFLSQDDIILVAQGVTIVTPNLFPDKHDHHRRESKAEHMMVESIVGGLYISRKPPKKVTKRKIIEIFTIDPCFIPTHTTLVL